MGKTNVLEGRPWLFDGNLVAVMDFDGFTPPSQMVFEKTAFWVRMYNLPLACMGSEIGHQIGSTIGKVEDVEVNVRDAAWREYLRVRIIIDLSKPLDMGRKINIKNKSTWVAFKYEKLPNFCYLCGVVRHENLGCAVQNVQHDGGLPRDTPFGPWLKVAPTFRKWRGGVDHKGRDKVDRILGSIRRV
jgi:hypothetical protein